MYTTFIRLIASLIPVKDWRHDFRDKFLSSPKNRTFPNGLNPDLEKRFKSLENKLDLLIHFSFQKETYPEIGKSYCVDFPSDEETLLTLRNHLYSNSGEGASVKRQYIAEQISLCNAFIHILPDAEMFRIFRRLISFCERGSSQYLALLGTYSLVLWRTGKHVENIELMNEFLPVKENIPSLMLPRFATSARFAGNEDLARHLMGISHKKYGTANLWKSYAAARLSADCGKRDEKINLVLKVGDQIMKNCMAGTLSRMIAGKRIAVVGNGPQEAGKGNGGKIDSYDIVIRFNDYPTNPKFHADYGTKTTIWVRSQWVPATFRRISNIVVGDALYYEYPNLDVLGEVLKANPTHIFAIPAEVYHELHNLRGLPHPTNGALMLAWLKSIHPELSANDVFGFSFKAELPPKSFDHYYDSPNLKKGVSHSLDKERVFLRALFDMN